MTVNFGKYAIVDPIEHTFDKMPDINWTIKSPTSGDELKMAKFMVNQRVELGPDGVKREFPPTNTEIAHREIAILFGGTNIKNDEGKPALVVGDNIQVIEEFLKDCPQPFVMELWSAIGEAIPGWGSIRPKAKKTSTP